MTSPTDDSSFKKKRKKKRNNCTAKDEERARKRVKKEKKRQEKRHRKEKKQGHFELPQHDDAEPPNKTTSASATCRQIHATELPLHKYILAPMVGASELAFRLLCRKYGAQLAYTPMMSSTQFAHDEAYRTSEFQTVPEDRPLVCHFSANDPEAFGAAAKLCEPYCDAIDLNLGCPQRTAYVGHFGSYLLDEKDRDLVLKIVKAGANAVSVPIFVKIRLLDKVEESITLCRQLRDAGASLIAIHARYRASFERKGPGARDGPAMLDQVASIKKAVPGVAIISNGNVMTYHDVVENLKNTGADGVMSAEGILDNPALFLPRLGSRDESSRTVVVAEHSPLPVHGAEVETKKRRKLTKKLRQIGVIETLVASNGESSINEEQRKKLATKIDLQMKLEHLAPCSVPSNGSDARGGPKTESLSLSLSELYKSADDPLKLADEYLSLVRRYPVKIRSVVFHIRRMLKDQLTRYQLMEECVACDTVDQVHSVVDKCRQYHQSPESFIYDREKALREKEILKRKSREEGKRKAFEARMIRKAKREGKSDLEFYLRVGAEVPTLDTLGSLKRLPREEQLKLWKTNHAQHCLAHHLDAGGCKRDRACAFLHSDAKGRNAFVESDEVAG